MTDMIFSTNGEEKLRIPPPFSHNHYVGTKCPETKLEVKEMTNNLPEPDDAPWLNLSQEEINQLRNQKYQLTKYGKEKLKELKEKQDKENTDK